MRFLVPDLEGIAVGRDLGLDYLAVEGTLFKGGGRAVYVHGDGLLEADEVAGHIAVAQADVLEVLAQALGDVAGAVYGVGEGQAEVLVLQGRAADFLLLIGLLRHTGAVRDVRVDLAVLVKPHKENVRDVGRYVDVLVEVAVLLCNFELGGVEHHGGADAVHGEVVVLAGDVAAVVIDEVHGLYLDVFGVPVALVGYVVDGVLIRDVRAQVGAAVGDMVLISAVHIGAAGYGLVVLRYAEHAALAQIVVAAHGGEAGVGYHGHEVGALLGEGVLQGVVVKGLDADGGEVRRVAVDVAVYALEHAEQHVDGAAAGVGHVLQARDPVVRGQLRDLAALAVHPGHTFADVEGIGQAVLADVITRGEMGLEHALAVVLVEVVDETRVVVEIPVAKEIPGGADAVEGGGGGVGKGVSLLGQVLYGALGIGTGAGELVPELNEVLIVFGGYYLVGKHHLVKVDTVTQPGGVAARAEGHAAHCIAAARGVHRRGDAALEELGLGYCHQRPALAERLGLKGSHIGVVKLAHRGHVDVLVVFEDAALGRGLLAR